MMTIADLPAPVTAARTVFLPSTNGRITFSPTSKSPDACDRCRASVYKQMGGRNGLVLEYVIGTLPRPNPGFESHPLYVADKATHSEVAGRLIAVRRDL
jgi:hypothetical protein